MVSFVSKKNKNLKPFFSFVLLNMDIPVIIQVVDLELSVYVLKVFPEGNVSQNFDLGLSFHFMSKTGNFWLFFQTFI